MEVALTRQNSRRRSFSQLSIDTSRKDLLNIEPERDDDWCTIDYAKHKKKKKLKEEDNYQSGMLYMRETELIIQRLENLVWKEVTKNIDFTQDPGPLELDFNYPTISYSDTEVALPAEEGILSTSVSVDESACNDKPCSSRSVYRRRMSLDPDTDAEAVKTDYESYDDSEDEEPEESFIDKHLRLFQEKIDAIKRPEELISIVSSNEVTENLLSESSKPQISSDEVLVMDNKNLRLKGSALWAPPKRKFIFDFTEPKDVQTLLIQQLERCAGCGMKFTKVYIRRARICNYYNKLFCQCCFNGEKTRIPARILNQWNFKEYPVSDFAYNFIIDHAEQPVYNVRGINPELYKKVKNLKKVRKLRIKASHMWQYIQICKAAETTMTTIGMLRTIFTSIPRRFISIDEVDVYSLLDFEAVESGNLIEMLEPIVACGKLHIEGCPECAQRSFFCSVCFNVKDPLFSFQLERVYQCDECGALSHLKCYNKLRRHQQWRCSRCERFRRKYIRLSTSSLSLECNSD